MLNAPIRRDSVDLIHTSKANSIICKLYILTIILILSADDNFARVKLRPSWLAYFPVV